MLEAYRNALQAGERAGMRYQIHIPEQSMQGQAGTRLGHQAGSSLDFKDFRDYQPGDDLRRIDWNAYARSDRLTVKLYREEVTPHVEILLDSSRSMALPNTPKAEAALGLAALFAGAADNARCTFRAWMQGEGIQPVAQGHLHPGEWQGLHFDRIESPADALNLQPPAWRNNSMRLFISDLLWPGDPAQFLRHLANQASALTVLQVLSREDLEPPERGNARLVDSESGEQLEVFIDAASQQRYLKALDRHLQEWHTACRQVGARLIQVTAEEFVEHWTVPQLEQAGVLGAA